MSAAHDCGGDAAAYVLGALEPDEAEAFRRHLTSCVVCRDEVTAFQQVAEALPMAAQHHEPPRRLRRRVLGAVRAEPHARTSAAERRRPSRRLPGLPSPALAVGALLVAVLAIAGIEISSSGSSGSRVIQASVIGSSGAAQLRVGGGRAELVVDRMPPPPAGHIYEVWLLKRGDRSPSPTSTLFSVTSSGAGDVGLTGDLHGVSEVLVTPEPAGGSLVPTHTPVIVAQLT